MNKKILVIEDDNDINQLITMNLRDLHYDVESCADGARGFQLASSGNFDLILLDVMLPGMDGLEICLKLRSAENYTPILMLTAKDSEADRVVGLEMGADDYLTKPFSVRELQARVKAMLRRVSIMTQTNSQSANDIMTFGELEIQVNKRQVKLKGQGIDLTSTEFDLLFYLASQPGLVFNRVQLLDKVWGYQHAGYEHTVNSHINRLRTKLELDPSNPEYVLTVWGVGYKFKEA
jgi:DNA-binding response OmpR family regulator